MGICGHQDRLDLLGEFVIAVWLHGGYSRASGGFDSGAATVIGRAAIGGEAVATGLPLPPSSSDSPALRRGDKERKSRIFEHFALLGPKPPFFLFFFSSTAVVPPAPPAVVVAF